MKQMNSPPRAFLLSMFDHFTIHFFLRCSRERLWITSGRRYRYRSCFCQECTLLWYEPTANQFLRYSTEKPNISNDYQMPICLAQLGHDSPVCATGATTTNTAWATTTNYKRTWTKYPLHFTTTQGQLWVRNASNQISQKSSSHILLHEKVLCSAQSAPQKMQRQQAWGNTVGVLKPSFLRRQSKTELYAQGRYIHLTL